MNGRRRVTGANVTQCAVPTVRANARLPCASLVATLPPCN